MTRGVTKPRPPRDLSKYIGADEAAEGLKSIASWLGKHDGKVKVHLAISYWPPLRTNEFNLTYETWHSGVPDDAE